MSEKFRTWWQGYRNANGSPAFKNSATVRAAVQAAFEAGKKAERANTLQNIRDKRAFEKWFKENITPQLGIVFENAPVARKLFGKCFEAGKVGLIRGTCAWCEKPVPPDTGGINHGDLYCDECDA